jgi:OST-HTH/LOTUS domain
VVYGFGERKTPEPFVAACDKFIYTEILRTKPEESKAQAAPTEVNVKPAVEVAELPELAPMILTALDAAARDDGWAPLGPLGSQMNKNNPSFDPRNYGFSQLSKLMRKQDYIEVKEVSTGDGSTSVHLFVRRKGVAGR